MASNRPLQTAALSDLTNQAQDKAALDASNAAVAISTPAFAAALKECPGGFQVDTKATPIVVYTASADGLTFTAMTASSLDDELPDPTTPVVPPVLPIN